MPEKRLPVNMMETCISDRATTPQHPTPGKERHTCMKIKQHPTLRAFVTPKITNTGFLPSLTEERRTRVSQSKCVVDHLHDQIIQITTPQPMKVTPLSTIFYPLGSVPGSVPACAGRPMTHEPGRHRFFVSDVRKIM